MPRRHRAWELESSVGIYSDLPSYDSLFETAFDLEPTTYNGIGAGGRLWRERFVYPALVLLAAGALAFLILLKSGQLSRERLLRFQGEGESAVSPQVPSEHPSLRPPESEDVEEWGAATAPSRVPSPSVSVRASEVVDRLEVPTVAQFEEALPAPLRRGKKLLADAIPPVAWTGFTPSAEDAAATAALAEVISGGRTDKLLGLSFTLDNVKQLNGSPTRKATTRSVTVTKFLGMGSSNLVLEVQDVHTLEIFALRVLAIADGEPTDSSEKMLRRGRIAMEMEEESAKQACGDTPAVFAASENGIAVPLFTADIRNVPQVTWSKNHHIFGHVQIMERLYGDMLSVAERVRIPQEAKEYVARRLILEVLHLQKVGLSHNDVKWNNIFMRSDGSFLMGDFGSSSPFGEPMSSMAAITPEYTEPDLLISFVRSTTSDAPVVPDQRSDLWSLGVLLYELHTEGDLPYGLDACQNRIEKAKVHARSLLRSNTSSSSLRPELEAAQVPDRWTQLIMRLLEPRRTDRITAEQIVKEFPDLVMPGMPRYG